ncbi:MAG: YybH family protein [Pirellulaceae bacterium]
MKTLSLTSLITLAIFSGVATLANAQQTDDERALVQLDQAYAAKWKEGDGSGVMELFTEDATLVPHHGVSPIKGHAAINGYWFNPDNPPTVIPEWNRTAQEILVVGDVGIVRGRHKLVWEYQGKRTTIPDGNYIMIAVRTSAGWKIRMLTWNDDPEAWIREEL